MRPQVGQVINNKYRLMRLIGDGGMGSVYEARHEVLGTTVALKFLHPELSRRSGLVQRFLQEARVSAQIQSPHVVRVTDVDQTSNGLAFIVMEYLEGRTLQTLYEDLYKAGARLSYGDALEYATQMLEGVEAAHRAGVVHRDLKPDNVIITKTQKGQPLLKLLDFGIAKLKVTGELDRGLTRPGVIMGTPEYMAPEQAYSANLVDARADIFSLGVMVFEMLAGRRPVGGDEPHEIAAAYLSGQIAKLADLAPGLAPELSAAIQRAIAPVPSDRFGSVAELRDAIEPFARAARTPAGLTPTPAGASIERVSQPAVAVAPSTQVPSDGGPPQAVPKTIPPEEEPQFPNVAPPVEASFSAEMSSAAAAQSGVSLTPPEHPSPVSPTPADDTPYPGFDASPRPGGTAVVEPSHPAAPPMQYEGQQPPQGTMMPATEPAGPYISTEPAPRKKTSGGPPLLLILLLATGIAGAAVGGVYIAHEYERQEERSDTLQEQPTPPTTSLASEPPPQVTTGTEPPATTPTLPPVIKPPTTTPTKPPTSPTQPTSPPTSPTSPPTQPTSPPTSPTSPPTQPTSPPTSPSPTFLPQLPPLVIPTTMPTLFPPILPPPTSPQPSPTPPASTGKPKGPIIFVPPKKP